MRLRDFIAQNRAELKECISRAMNYVPKEASCYCPLNGTNHYHNDIYKLDTEELRLWILSDEGLYRWARSEGCNI